MKFDNMPDNMKSTEVFFRLERCANIFSRLSSIIPKQLSLEEEDMKYKVVFSNGTAKIVDHPNFIKMNPRYPSFVCCGRDDAECVMLQEGEESICYNIAVKRYPEYDVVDVRTV